MDRRSDSQEPDTRHYVAVSIVHGDEDAVIPISLARRLFEVANEPKTFMLVSGGKHLVLGLAEVFRRVREWIDEKTGVARGYGDARE
jgi:alpha-beta hydrolase superfamily lysophospholipase